MMTDGARTGNPVWITKEAQEEKEEEEEDQRIGRCDTYDMQTRASRVGNKHGMNEASPTTGTMSPQRSDATSDSAFYSPSTMRKTWLIQ